MKQRHQPALRLDAIETLHSLNISRGQDFHTLSSDQVLRLLDEANRQKYQKPKNANGSRARYFHDRLQRLAK